MSEEITAAMLDDWEVGTRALIENVREPSGRRILEESLAVFALARKGLETQDPDLVLELERDRALAKADRYRKALEEIAYGDPDPSTSSAWHIARAALEGGE